MAVVHCSQQPPQPGVRRRPAVDTAAASTVRQLLWELASGGPTSRSTRHGGGWALRKRPPGVLREAEGRGRATDRARPARRRGSAQTHTYGAHATAATSLFHHHLDQHIDFSFVLDQHCATLHFAKVFAETSIASYRNHDRCVLAYFSAAFHNTELALSNISKSGNLRTSNNSLITTT